MKVVTFLKSNIFQILTNTRKAWAGCYVNDPFYFPDESYSASIMTILEIHSYGVLYREIRDDPVFPAKGWNRDRQSFQNNETWPRLLGCADTASICDPHMIHCSIPHFTCHQRQGLPRKSHIGSGKVTICSPGGGGLSQ